MPRMFRPLLAIFLLAALCSSCQRPTPHVIGFAQCTMGDAWRQAMVQEMARELAYHDDVELVVRDAQNSSDLQVQQIDALIAQGVDLLIVSPNEASPIAPAIERASQQGIPVIVIDRKTTTTHYTTYIGADNYRIGYTAGEYIAQRLGGQGTLLEVTGLPGSSPAIDRGAGFRAAIAQYPELRLLATVDGQWLQDTAMKALAPFAERLGGVDALFAHNDPMALGAYQVSRAHATHATHVPLLVGVDGLAAPGAGLDLVLRDTLDATLLYPTGGSEAIKAAMQLLAGDTVPRHISLETTLIDDRNVEVMRQQADRMLRQQADIERQQDKLAALQRLFKNQQTWLAAVLFLLLVVTGLGVSTLRQLRTKQRTNRELAAKNAEILQQRNQIAEMADKTQAAQAAKIQLFTNISHEFRTPLSLILAPVEELLALPAPRPIHQHARLIRANALRLLRLVTQLMDFRRMEHAKLHLHAAEQNLVALVREVMEAFAPLATRQGVDFRLNALTDEVFVWYDAQLLDKVLFNLYSNAFKFLDKPQGRIYTSIALERDGVRLTVADNGKGMTEEERGRIFERFYSGAQAQGREGVGLGLALSREWIHLHGGTITVKSMLGQGTQFEVWLPLGDAHLTEADKQPAQSMALASAEWVDAEERVRTTIPLAEGLPDEVLLIVEDNAELRAFLAEQFAPHFRVVTAADGVEGLEAAQAHVPDVVVCDVMLPKRSGLQVVATLKQDVKTSHIPVLLLTAQDTVEQQIEGLALGAEGYLTKPFHMGVLLEKVRALLRHRNVLRARYLTALPAQESGDHSPKGQEEGTSALDRQFVNAFRAVVEAHLGDSGLQVETITQALGLSRVQLYRKVRALLGYSVGDYIKHVRLKKAAALLCESDEPIANVAYAVGFASPAYFSTAFKAAYGCSPSEYRAQEGG